MSRMSLPAVPMENGLAHYFREVWKFPILKADDEYMLAVRWRQDGDVDAAHQLVTSHLRLVAKIAMNYRNYGLPVSDLMSEGNIGLMKAVKKFEPERGFRLSTYAIWWIKAAITEYVLKSWSLVRMGTMSAQKKLFFSLRRIKSRMDMLDNGDFAPEQAEELARKLNVSKTDLVDMNRRMSSRDMSLNAPVLDDESVSFQDTLEDDGPSPEILVATREDARIKHGMLETAIEGLPERERNIFRERRLADDPMTLEQLGKVYGISRERVRQLENRAYDRVSKAVQNAAHEVSLH